MNSFAEKNKDVLLLIARIFLALLFIRGGYHKLMDPAGVAQYISNVGGLPAAGILVYLVIATELVGGLAILVGLATRWAAFLLAGFTILTIVFFHNPFSDPEQWTAALKNLCIAGGFVALWATGAGKLAVMKN